MSVDSTPRRVGAVNGGNISVHPAAIDVAAIRQERINSEAALRRFRVGGKAVLAAVRLRHGNASVKDPRVQRELQTLHNQQEAVMRRLNAIDRAIADYQPSWADENVPALSQIELLKYARTGRWKDLAPKISLSWGILARAEATNNARTAYQGLKSVAEQARSVGGVPEAATGSTANGVSEWIRTLIISCQPDIKLPDLSALANVAHEILGQEALSLIATTIPFLSTIAGALKTANAVRKAVELQLAKSGAEEAAGRLRPGTPEIACGSVVADLEYYRNVQAGTAAISTAATIASIFDGGLGSGPASTLANLAVSVHGLYRTYQEKCDFEGLVGPSPYEALKRSGTVSAYVLVNYPAIGLVDPSRVQFGELEEVISTWFFGLLDSRDAPVIEQRLLQIRKAGAKVLDASRLKVEVI